MYEVYTLKVGEEVTESPIVYYLNNWGEKVKVFHLMWLIKGKGKVILVETGYSREIGQKYGAEQKSEEDPLKQLAARGVTPDDVNYVILTHVHYDHLSPVIDSFKKAKIFVQRKEIQYVTAPPHPWFVENVMKEVVARLCNQYLDRVEFVDGEAEVLEGISVFHTGGHTPGHQSVIVNTKEGKVIMTGDVVPTYRNIEEDIPIGLHTDVEECYLAMKRIRKEGGIILPGHEPLIMERLGVKIG